MKMRVTACLLAFVALVPAAGCSLLGFFEAPPSDCDAPPCPDADADADADADSDTDGDTDADADSDVDAGVDSGRGPGTDGGTDGDGGSLGDAGTDAGPSCGDGVVQPERGESCDPPNDSDCSGDCVYVGLSCDSSDDCVPPYCVDGVCCNEPCDQHPCETCGLLSSAGAGTCGWVSSADGDPDGDCTPGKAGEPGSCRTGFCSGTNFSCGTLPEGEQQQPACKRCPGGSEDPVNIANGSRDQDGDNVCDTTCTMCWQGACSDVERGWDPFDRCGPLTCCGGDVACGATGSCDEGWQSIPIGDCGDCSDDWCWNHGECARRRCEWLNDGRPDEGYYCMCFLRGTC